MSAMDANHGHWSELETRRGLTATITGDDIARLIDHCILLKFDGETDQIMPRIGLQTSNVATSASRFCLFERRSRRAAMAQAFSQKLRYQRSFVG